MAYHQDTQDRTVKAYRRALLINAGIVLVSRDTILEAISNLVVRYIDENDENDKRSATLSELHGVLIKTISALMPKLLRFL